MQHIPNPFESIHAKLEELAAEIRALRNALKEQPERDEIGQMEMAMEVTGLARRTIYKLTHMRRIPHQRVARAGNNCHGHAVSMKERSIVDHFWQGNGDTPLNP